MQKSFRNGKVELVGLKMQYDVFLYTKIYSCGVVSLISEDISSKSKNKYF